MKNCTYCGKEYPDDFASSQCEIDGTVLTTDVAPLLDSASLSSEIITPPPIPRRLSDRHLRYVEIILVCVIAFGGFVLSSIYLLFGDGTEVGQRGSLSWIYAMLQEVSALGLLWYVLSRRSKSFADLGCRWKLSDLGWSIILYFGGALVFGVVYRLIFISGLAVEGDSAANSRVAMLLFGKGVFVTTFIFQFINPFFEELIVRAFVITEIRELSKSVPIAVMFSVALQTSYHFYQGIPLALSEGGMFFVWSIYYAKTNRIAPIILAHLYMDVGATLAYAIRTHV